MNVVVVVGRLASPPRRRVLPSGDSLVEYEVTVRTEGRPTETVPVVWPAAPASAVEHPIEAELMVVGRVRRRFFRAGGGTASRTEVVADTVVPARPTRRARAALAGAAERLAVLEL